MKQSGSVDIYYNMKLRDTIEQKVSKMELSFDSFYFTYPNGTVDEIDLAQRNRAIYRNRNPMFEYDEKKVIF
jgi:hypothetical protein